MPPDPATRCFAGADFAFTSDHSALTIVRVVAGKATLVDWLELRPKKGDYAANIARLGQVFAQLGLLETPPDVLVLAETALTGYFLEGGVREAARSAGEVGHHKRSLQAHDLTAGCRYQVGVTRFFL